MAIDSAIKRASAMGVGQFPIPITIIPDGTIAKFDRQTIMRVYGGIATASPVGGAERRYWRRYGRKFTAGHRGF